MDLNILLRSFSTYGEKELGVHEFVKIFLSESVTFYLYFYLTHHISTQVVVVVFHTVQHQFIEILIFMIQHIGDQKNHNHPNPKDLFKLNFHKIYYLSQRFLIQNC